MEKLYVFGTGNAQATRCYNTCFAIRDEDEYFMVDVPQSGVLNVVLDAERCAWRLDTPEGDVQQQGEGLYALLDLMQGLDSGLVGMSNVNWMRV